MSKKRVNKTTQLVSLFSNIANSELRITGLISDAIKRVYTTDGLKHNSLSFVYSAVALSGDKIRPAQHKAIDTFVNNFVAVSYKKLENAIVLDAAGNVTFTKNESRHKTLMRKLMDDETLTEVRANELVREEEFHAHLAALMDAYLLERKGNLFAKPTKDKVEKTTSEKDAARDKRQLAIASEIAKSDMTRSEKAVKGMEFLTALGFTTVAEFQAAMAAAL